VGTGSGRYVCVGPVMNAGGMIADEQTTEGCGSVPTESAAAWGSGKAAR
jgi:hypothetical protein